MASLAAACGGEATCSRTDKAACCAPDKLKAVTICDTVSGPANVSSVALHPQVGARCNVGALELVLASPSHGEGPQ